MTRRASTIIETVIYVGLLTAMVATLMSFLVSIIKREAKVSTQIEVNQNARFVINKISDVVRNSKDATVPLDGETGSVLELTMPEEELSPTVFEVTEGVLTMKQGTAAAVPLTSTGVKVSDLTFTNLVDPVAHARTAPTWTPCAKKKYLSWWFGVCCYNGADVCWDAFTAWWHIFILHDATAGSCYVSTAAKSVIRIGVTVTAPDTADAANDYASSVTLFGTATVPRQN